MTTFGSYGNLGGELVSVVEVDSSTAGIVYTVPAQRYSLVVIRYMSTGLIGTFVRFNYSSSFFEYGNRALYPAEYFKNAPSAEVSGGNDQTPDDFQPKLMNAGESITISGSSVNFLIFEYRKP